jgi:predicted Fe-Mo cluster-binding NifX family protein
MKILIATQGTTLNDQVAKRFGHAPFYLLVDMGTLQTRVIANWEHDEDHSIIPRMKKDGVEVFITGNIGPHAFELIRSLNLQVALARKMSAKAALEKLQRGELEFLDAPTLKHSVHEHKQDYYGKEEYIKKQK